MALKHYYVSLYQALINKNFTEYKKLTKLNKADKDSYSNEYPDLEYNDIYTSKYPWGFLNEFIANDQDTEQFHIDAPNNLANEETISIRENNYSALTNYPLLNSCPASYSDLLIVDTLASITYRDCWESRLFLLKLVA